MTNTPTATQHLNTRIADYLDELAALTDEARFSETMQAYLDTCARFHRYSWHNTFLILWGKPDAIQVAGYKKWLEFNRHVKKGEKGIPILAPIVVKQDKDNPNSDTLLRFKVVYVFDISQTEGDPLPEPPDWKNPEQHQELTAHLLAFAASRGIRITVESLSGETQGVSTGGAIALSPNAGTQTLIHELAHELLHQGQPRESRSAVETEAEAVAYVVARHFGLTGLNSPNYLALWNADSKVIRAHIERISQCANQIITALETNSQPTL